MEEIDKIIRWQRQGMMAAAKRGDAELKMMDFEVQRISPKLCDELRVEAMLDTSCSNNLDVGELEVGLSPEELEVHRARFNEIRRRTGLGLNMKLEDEKRLVARVMGQNGYDWPQNRAQWRKVKSWLRRQLKKRIRW